MPLRRVRLVASSRVSYMPLPSYDPFPKYLQIREIIIRWLGTLNLGDKLPTEQRLSEQFRVSRVTIRQALHSLEQDGTIARKAGYGTWLSRPIVARFDERLTGPIEDFDGLGQQTTTVLVSQGVVIPTPEVASSLRLRPNEKVFEIQRTRLVDGRPLHVLGAFFPVSIGRKIGRRKLGNDLLVPILRELQDPLIWEESQRIEATVATEALAEMLQIDVGQPILNVNRTFVDASGQPVVYFKTQFRADRYYYTVKLPQPKMAAGNPKKDTAQKKRAT
jgi:GntR family transcriptional regulator